MSTGAAAVVIDGQVTNTVAVTLDDDRNIVDWQPDNGSTAVVIDDGQHDVGIGWSYDGTAFTAPPDPSPDSGGTGA